jgi:DNA-binding CsgD family transcriptional regulator/sugar-specific transcriptional regulator TrmB
MLKPFGVDGTAETVYRTMIVHRDWNVAQVAHALELPESDIRAALDRLADLALVRQSLENPGMLRPVDPEFGLLSLVQTRQAELHRSQQELAESHAAVSELISTLQTAAPRVEIDQLIGIDEIQSRIEVLANRATTECLSFMPAGAQTPESIAAGTPLNDAALERGVAIRTLYLDSLRNDPPTFRYATWLTGRGGEVRTRPTLPARLLVVDREIALLPLDLAQSRAGAIQLTTHSVVLVLTAFFEHLWLSATPFHKELPRDDAGVTGQERELLSLLSQGLTDEMAGRRLGLSLRTVRRNMADLMDRLGAKSRFEAGMRASERGWLS